MTGAALLLFQRGSTERTADLLERVRPYVDQVCVVDSSAPWDAERLRRVVESEGGRLLRYLPFGMTEPYRPRVHREMGADWVLSLDIDETPSGELLRSLADARTFEGYEIPRQETDGFVSYHLKWYRPTFTAYRGYIHEVPEVHGRLARLPLRCQVHHAFRTPGDASHRERLERYARLEAYQRPMAGWSVEEEFHSRLLSQLRWRDPEEPISWLEAKMLGALVRYRPRRPPNRRAPHRRNAQELARYVALRTRRFQEMDLSAQREASRIAHELRHAGGLVPYLELDRAGRLEGLTQEFDWTVRGEEVLRRLLLYRHRTQHAATSWGEVAAIP